MLIWICKLSSLDLILVMVERPVGGYAPPRCVAASSSSSSSFISSSYGGGIYVADALMLFVFFFFNVACTLTSFCSLFFSFPFTSMYLQQRGLNSGYIREIYFVCFMLSLYICVPFVLVIHKSYQPLLHFLDLFKALTEFMLQVFILQFVVCQMMPWQILPAWL